MRATDNPNKFRLEFFELAEAAQLGLARNLSAINRGLTMRHGGKDLGWEIHIDAAISEKIFSRCKKIYHNTIFGKSDKHRGDVGPYQIKCITNPDYNLVIRYDDPEQFPYVLILLRYQVDKKTGCGFISGEILGWIYGFEGKTESNLVRAGERRGIHTDCYIIELDDLHSPDLLLPDGPCDDATPQTPVQSYDAVPVICPVDSKTSPTTNFQQQFLPQDAES